MALDPRELRNSLGNFTTGVCLVTALDGHRVEVRFDRPVRAIAPGQAAVFYRGDQVLGGAVIEHGFGRAP